MSYKFCDGVRGGKTWLRGFPCDGLVAVEPQPRACGMSTVPIVTLTVTLLSLPLHPLEMTQLGERKCYSQQSGSYPVSHVTLMVIPLGWPLSGIFGTLDTIFCHSAWLSLSFAKRVAGCHIVGEYSGQWASKNTLYCALGVRVFVKIFSEERQST